MPGVVSSLPPLAADTFEMAKTDDNFHIECLTGFVVAATALISSSVKLGREGKAP
jgi:hypothetical protein